MSGDALDDAAEELYAVPPGRFVEARAERVAAAKAAGDKELAKAVGALRRPTAAAWAVNLLVRGRGEQVRQLVALGDAMREAQAGLEGEELRRLTKERRQVVAALARQARADARAAGTPISEAVEEEVAATLLAALADPVAGDAVLAGRLTKALEYSGVGPVDADAVAAASSRPVLRSVPTGTSAGAAPSPSAADARAEEAERERRREEARRRALAEARARLDAAQEEAGRLAAAAREADEAATRAEDGAEQAQADVERLEAELERARTAQAEARRCVSEAERSQRAAHRHADAADAAVAAARREVDRLGG